MTKLSNLNSASRLAIVLVLLGTLAISQCSITIAIGPAASAQQVDFDESVADSYSSSVSGKWAVIGPSDLIPEIRNVAWLFGNQSIPFVKLYPEQITDYAAIKDYAGLVTWTRLGSVYNCTAVRSFAKTKPVISHVFDFCHYLYPSFDASLSVVSTTLVTYIADWGIFRKGDRSEMQDGTNDLATVKASALAGFANVTVVARFNATQVALFHMSGVGRDAGFYVMDLYCTRPNSYESGNWHLFPAIGKAATIKVGQYCRWMTDGLSWRSLNWVYSWMANFTKSNSDIVTMRSIGTSVLGRPINAIFIGQGRRYFMADAAIHGNEKAGTLGIIRFAELVVNWYRTITSWKLKLGQYRIILIPVLNPDGYAVGAHGNANGKDLNRQFPPGGTTTEPEAWALRWLMGNYTPAQYVTFHVGSDVYPLNAFYTGLSVDPYRTYFRYAVSEGNRLFQSLQHWGVYGKIQVGKYYYVGPSGINSMSAEYAYYEYRSASVTAEHWGSARANLHSQEFYITVALALLLHHDRPSGFMIHSNAFLVTTDASAVELGISIDERYIPYQASSNTRICIFRELGKPKSVIIDGTQKAEGNGWFWNDSTNSMIVVGADESIYLGWQASLPWDVNHDRVVDIIDLALVSAAYGSTSTSKEWNPDADINGDGKVDIEDLLLVIGHMWSTI